MLFYPVILLYLSGIMKLMKKQDSEISTLIHWGSEDCAPGHEYGGVRDYYLIHIITQGQGEYQCGGRKWTLGKGNAFLIFPGQRHLYRAHIQNPWSYFWLGFQGNFSEVLSDLRVDRNNPIIDYHDVKELQRLFEGIPEPRIYQHPAETLENRGRFLLILGLLLHSRKTVIPVSRNVSPGSSHHVQSMETYIQEYFNTAIQVQDVIDFVQLERSYASRIFKEEMGKSIGESLREYRFNKAKEYLAEGWSAKETAYSCGFKDYNNFLKAFKKWTGKTTAAYKLDFSSHSVSTDT